MRVTADDIAALKAEEGGLAVFIAALTANQPATQAPAPPVIGSAHGPGHKPGAWPAGTRTDRDTCNPDCDCAIHVQPAAPAHQPAA